MLISSINESMLVYVKGLQVGWGYTSPCQNNNFRIANKSPPIRFEVSAPCSDTLRIDYSSIIKLFN